MKKQLEVNLGENSYVITVERGLIDRLGEALSQIYSGKRVFIITHEHVHRLYAKRAEHSLHSAGFLTDTLVLPAGEATKSFPTLPVIYDRMLDFQLNRKELIITLGGGVIGDLGGFAASTFLRGVAFVQVPTTLLAQVDSSVGGKVGVDLAQGKNLVGSFYQPKAVLIDPDVLDSLPERVFKDGMAEVIKYGCIRDKVLFEKLVSLCTRGELMTQIEEIIYTCCNIKKTVVESDEKDFGDRMLLNFGHTYGHAVEKYYHFERYTHGEAVAIGMIHITRISEQFGITKAGTLQRLTALLHSFGLPTDTEIEEHSKILESIALDKKVLGDRLTVVLLKQIGESMLYETTPEFFNTHS